MISVFADTCYWVALTDRQDSLYALAKEQGQLWKDSLIVTSDSVLTEYLAMFAKRGDFWRRQAADTVDRLLRATRVRVVAQTHEGFTAALALYRQRLDKGYTLVDCESMNIMRSRGIAQVLTEDQHFRQEGFVPLLQEQ